MPATSNTEIIDAIHRCATTMRIADACSVRLLQAFADAAGGFPSGGQGSATQPVESLAERIHRRARAADPKTIGHETSDRTNVVERAALGPPDDGRRARGRLASVVLDLDKTAVQVEQILQAWLNGLTIDPRTVVNPVNEIWCTVHYEHGMEVVKAKGRSTCHWCANFRQHQGRYPNKDLLELHDRKRGITQLDIDRLMPKKKPKGKKK